MSLPAVGELVRIGTVEGIICQSGADGIRAIYMEHEKPIVRSIIASNGQWTFERPSPDGNYADRFPQYHSLIAKLRRG